MSDRQEISGGCLCGAVRYEAMGAPLQVAYCHCESCRRSIGAAFAIGVGFPAKDVTWIHQEPASYQSSENFARLFCSQCGSSLAQHNLSTAKIWLQIGTLDHPESVTPDLHMFADEKISWIKLKDALPRHAQWPTEIADGD